MTLREFSETPLQMAIADYLGGKIYNGKNVIDAQGPFPGLVWSYTGGEGRDSSDIYWLSRKGRRKGIWDYVSWYIGLPPQAIESKSKTGGLSPKQITFRTAFEAAGGITCIVTSVAQVRDFYIGLGIPCQNTNAREPKPSFKEKMAFQQEMYRSDYHD